MPDNNKELVGEAYAALEWCVEVIGEENLKKGSVPPEHVEKLEEINRILTDLAAVVDPAGAGALGRGVSPPLAQVEFTLGDGRKFSVKRLL